MLIMPRNPFQSETDICFGEYARYLLLLGVLLALDIVTTTWILMLGGVEYNPFMAGVAASPAMHAGIKVLFALVILIWTRLWSFRVANADRYILSALCAWFFIVVAYNCSSLIPPMLS